MGNISSQNTDLFENKYIDNDFEVISETNSAIVNNDIKNHISNDIIVKDLKKIQDYYNKLFSIYKDIIVLSKEKKD